MIGSQPVPSADSLQKMRRRHSRASQLLVSYGSMKEIPADETFERIPFPESGNGHLREILAKHFIFAALSQEQLEEVLSKMIFVRVPAEQFLFKQHSIAKFFFVIEKGEVDILIEGVRVKEMGPKSLIGDLALLYNTPRTASVQAISECRLWALDGAEFKSKLVALKRAQYLQSSEFVNRIEVFAKLTPEQRERLASEMLLESYASGTAIVSQGDDATAMFVVRSGKVEIIRDDKFVTFLEADSYFGENAFAEQIAKRSATVRAVGPVQCFSISRGVLKDLFGHDVNVVVSMNEQRKLFSSSQTLRDFSEEQTERLLRELKIVNLLPGTVLFTADQPLETIALVMDGELTPKKKVIGDEVLRDPYFRLTSDCIALTPCKICLLEVSKIKELFGEDLEALFEKNKQFKSTMMNSSPDRKMAPLDLDSIQVVRPLGEGNFGSVYLVNKDSLQFALKVVPFSRITNVADAKSLISEKSILQIVEFPKIMSLYSFLKNHNVACFLSEFIDGVGFEKVLIELDILTQETAVFYSAQILLILQYLHLHGIIYRDLKPANLICKKNGYVKLVDMGTSKLLNRNKFGVFERTFTVIGTAHYMGPEIISGAGYTFSADYWAFGVMIYEMMCGCLPFGNDCDDPMQIYQQITNDELTFPDWFDDELSKKFIGQLLAKVPQARTGSSLWALNTHDWFKGVDWHKILFENAESPFMPQSSSSVSLNSLNSLEHRVQSFSELIARRTSLSDMPNPLEAKKLSDLWEGF